MTLRTGTSKSGNVYRYYTCSSAMRMGASACKGRSIPMDKLDQLVTDHVADRILVPDRLEALLQSVAHRRLKTDAEVQARIEALRREVGAAEEKLKRLYKLVEEGLTDLDDMLKERLAKLKTGREKASSALERIESQGPATRLDGDKIARFGILMREKIAKGEIPFRKAYLRSLIDAVEVGDRIVRIHGSKTVLERAVLADQAKHPGVRSFVRNWRAQRDSNPCFRRERATSWTARRWAQRAKCPVRRTRGDIKAAGDTGKRTSWRATALSFLRLTPHRRASAGAASSSRTCTRSRPFQRSSVSVPAK